MIHEFQSYEELEEEILKEKDEYSISSNRFPVRFIFLNSHDELKEIVNLLSKHDAKKEELSSMLNQNYKWFTDDKVIEKIKEINETTVIVPLSEYIRFSNDEGFKKILTALSEIENNKIKIYVPLVGLWGRFNNIFWKNFYRKDNWAPIWKLNTEPKKIKIHQVNFKYEYGLNTNSLELISTTKEWFNLWKKNDITEIISLPKQLSIFFKNSLPDQTFSREIINTPKEYLSIILNMDIDIEYDEKDEKYWNKLLLDVGELPAENNTFEDYFKYKFNVHNTDKMSINEYLELYYKNSMNEYEKWIIKNFFMKYNAYENSYLYQCFKTTNTLDNHSLTNAIFLEIFNETTNKTFFEERRKLLHFLTSQKEKILDEEFENKFKNIENLNYKEQLKYLTNNTLAEKQKIIEIIQENGVENTIGLIKDIYPELYYYLDWNLNIENLDSWIIDYFKEYNESKLLNTKSKKLDEILTEKNHPTKFHNWYYSIPPISKNSLEEKNNYVIWIDALGAEWLPLFINLLNKYGKKYGNHVKFKTINSVNIPSATKFNKYYSDKKISILDEYIHKNHYKHPLSLIEEIEIIKKIAEEIATSGYQKISIISDHGFSCLCNKKFGNSKKYDFKDAEHGGRYVSVENKGNDSEDYIFVETESEAFNKEIYRVASKHVSLHNTPSQEVHGGATPEEVLVPFIILENNNEDVYYNISAPNEINISKNRELSIEIKPKPTNLPVAIYNITPLEVLEKDTGYSIQLPPNMKKGEQNIIIKIDGEIVDELKINIKKGGMESNDDKWFK